MMADVGGIAERQRQQDRHAIGAAQSRKHADDDAEHDAEDHHHDVERLQRDRKAVKQIDEFFHPDNPQLCVRCYRPSHSSIGPLGSGTRN